MVRGDDGGLLELPPPQRRLRNQNRCWEGVRCGGIESDACGDSLCRANETQNTIAGEDFFYVAQLCYFVEIVP